MAFEQISGRGRAGRRNAPPEVSYYGKTSQFRLNSAAMLALAEGNNGEYPERLKVMYDADTNRVGFVIATEDDANAVKLNRDNDTTPSRFFGFRALADRAGLERDAKWVVPLEYDSALGMFVIDLSGRTPTPLPEVPTRRGRRRESDAAVATEAPAEAAA